ncbi:MAG TPA: hypothetical protein VD907_06480 [Verrucomicrobiae bacterium]|nr:hypothetical protein [Verrucomicrobiae bacterium]
MADVKGNIATLIDPNRKVLALYIMRTGLFRRTPSLSRRIADLHSKVDSCVSDFIVVYDDDEIIVIVDTNQAKKDQQAFNELTRQIRLLLAEGGAYTEVEYPGDPQYDPRKIYDSDNYGGFKVARKRQRFFRPR